MRNQHDEAFDEFATTAWPRLHRIGYLLTGDHHLAEDLAQAALVRTYSSWSRVRAGDAPAYARRVLLNLNIDRLRRRRVVEVGDAALDVVPEAGRSTVEDRDLIVRLLAGLTERERRVVVLRHYCDLSEAAVAAELGIAPGTVKSALSRALAKLRVSITEDTDELRGAL
ncbi:SigE family RNA polymerase sigma factor [Nocardioides nitrophenolicus]|uniref:SigE family RNA polymerase sigma factor n=1 Tax=Nocardioides nitrophenolicus TaxID=60489 RepID=UPI00195E7D3D|nr:SigE family RNA polymerase sigma factor [Nocardioides nitrophenolicus]MBM7520258.1 RNA polymerase sigma-70 factor (sigma-E family) [Nocardioides nitrophenolicus]